jgi:uncharacterized protein
MKSGPLKGIRTIGSEIKDNLRVLPLVKQIAFGASCCERLLPNYLAFSLMEGWGDFRSLRNLLDLVWTAVIDESKWTEITQISLKDTKDLAPHCDDFSTLFTPLAGDAVASIVYTIGAYLNPNESIEKLRLVLQVTENSLYQFLAAVNDPELDVHGGDASFEESIFHYPLMLAELEKQRQDIAYLLDNQLNEAAVFHLKTSSSISGIQPLKRGLVKEFLY